MTANINTIEDLMRALDENPEWLEAMRVRLLTRELLELPEKFTQLTVTVNQLAVRMDQLTDRVDQLAVRMDQLTDRVDQLAVRMDQLAVRMDQLTDRMDQLTDTVNQIGFQLNQFIEAANRRFDDLEIEVKKHSVQIGELKGLLARNIVIDEAALVARGMRLRRTRNLRQEELWDMTEASDTTGISTDDLKSFRKADLVLEATDLQGETCYVAVEISYTVNGRDTRRAIRNAGFLTRFTGTPAYAAVAGFQVDYRIQDSVEDGQVSWYQMDPFILNPE